MSRRVCACALGALVLSGAARADLLYGFDILDQSIFRIDTDTGKLEKFYGHPVDDYGDLDFDSHGNLFLEQAGRLFKIDLADGGDTKIGDDNFHHELEGFTILGDKGYAVDTFDRHTYEVDLGTNVITPIGAYGGPDFPVMDLTDDNAGTIWGVRINQHDVIRLDPVTGINLGVVATGLPDNVTSLAYGSENNLWFIPAFDTTLYSLDLGTGEITKAMEGLDVLHVSGLTAYTVPGPGAAWLLGAAGLIAARRRRNSPRTGTFGATRAAAIGAVLAGGAAAMAGNSSYAYVTGSGGNPWGLSDPEDGMNACFGSGNYDEYAFETADAATLFNDQRHFVYLEGSEHGADAMESFLNTNSALIDGWVHAGGRLLINSAPNQGDGMDLGFGVKLIYEELDMSSYAADPSHPVYQGPFTPVQPTMDGNYFSHAYVLGDGLSPITMNTWGHMVLAEEQVGQGHIVAGGISMPGWWFTQPEGYDLYDNIIYYSAGVPAPGTGLVVGGGLAASGRRRR